jgi:hypothetical protein
VRGIVPQILVAGMELSVDVLLTSWLQGAGVASRGFLLLILFGLMDVFWLLSA